MSAGITGGFCFAVDHSVIRCEKPQMALSMLHNLRVRDACRKALHCAADITKTDS